LILTPANPALAERSFAGARINSSFSIVSAAAAAPAAMMGQSGLAAAAAANPFLATHFGMLGTAPRFR